MIETMNNTKNTLGMKFKYIDNHTLSLPEITGTTMNSMFGGIRDGTGERRRCL